VKVFHLINGASHPASQSHLLFCGEKVMHFYSELKDT